MYQRLINNRQDFKKFITLARLLPHVENNFNFMELGPKGTGKSHVFQELSPYGVLVSGGDVTSARLFVNKSFNRGKATHEASASMSFVGLCRFLWQASKASKVKSCEAFVAL